MPHSGAHSGFITVEGCGDLACTYRGSDMDQDSRNLGLHDPEDTGGGVGRGESDSGLTTWNKSFFSP